MSFCLAVSLSCQPLQAEPDQSITTLIDTLTPDLARTTMREIPEPARQLLALRSYLRAGKNLDRRWSWTEDEIEAYNGSPEQRAQLAEVAEVQAHFSQQNPGFELYVNTRVRSLEVQIEHWNENQSVGVAATELLAAMQAEFLDGTGKVPDPENAAHWLRGFRNSEPAHLAAPGLTPHGRAHALDFQIAKDGLIHAAAESSQIETVWRAEGWDKALQASISAAGPSFIGPLTSPDEPWHFEYEPGRSVREKAAVD